MSKHTPGPWHWEADEIKNDPFGRVRYQVTTTGKTITRVYYSSYEGGQTNAEWDSRLIAAAPELLEALMSILAFWPSNASFERMGLNSKPMDRAYRDAVAAIAKATGEQS